MNNYPIVDAVFSYFDEISSNNTILSFTLTAVTDGYRVLRSFVGGYDDPTGFGTVQVQHDGVVVFHQPVSGHGREFDFRDFPIVSSEGKELKVLVLAGGLAIKGHINGVYQ